VLYYLRLVRFAVPCCAKYSVLLPLCTYVFLVILGESEFDIRIRKVEKGSGVGLPHPNRIPPTRETGGGVPSYGAPHPGTGVVGMHPSKVANISCRRSPTFGGRPGGKSGLVDPIRWRVYKPVHGHFRSFLHNLLSRTLLRIGRRIKGFFPSTRVISGRVSVFGCA